MRYRALGQSGIEASVIGLGTWGIGGWMWGGVDEELAIHAIRAAMDQGIDLIDTAPIYGFGLSEELVGKAIDGRRDKVVLATKCGMVCNTTNGELKFRSDVSGPKPNGHIGIYIYLHPDSIRAELEASLQRLKTDYIDLYQTHWQESTTPIEDTMGTLLKLKDEGKIRAIGVCNATGEQMEQYRQVGPIDSDQEKYSMLDREIEEDQLPYCRESSIAVLAYSPLAKGLLTGKISPDQQFDPGDQRSSSERFSSENIEHVNEMLDAVDPVADAHDVEVSQLVLAWMLHQQGLTHVLVGSRSAGHVRENAAAADIELKEDEVELITNTIEDYTTASVNS